MKDKGFAIRCPHCLEWREENRHPSKVALRSVKERRKILASLKNEPKTFDHPKLFCCNQPLYACPAPSEMFVCNNEQEAQLFLREVDAWSIKRDFHLYRSSTRALRWPKYIGVLFNTRPVQRQRFIELQNLMDRSLLAHAIVGLGEEIRGPLTVFAAQTFENKKKVITTWVPIEAYARGRMQAPPKFSKFCKIVREAITCYLMAKFRAKKPEPQKCPLRLGIGDMCAGRQAACLREDWNSCPAFLELVRLNKCLCYQSDRQMIGAVQRKWLRGDASPTIKQCWAGLTEIGFPIVVHGLLVGVAMTGQLVMETSRQRSFNSLIEKSALLRSVRDELFRAYEVLYKIRTPSPANSDEHYTARFHVNEAERKRRISIASSGVDRIAKVASSQYHLIRARSEMAFKQELTGRMANEESRQEFKREPLLFFGDPLLDILVRMRHFWAIKAACLMVVPPKQHDIYMVGYSRAGKGGRDIQGSLGFPGKSMGRLALTRLPDRPQPCFYHPKTCTKSRTRIAKDLLSILDRIRKDKSLGIPQSPFYFAVIVPVAKHLFVFLFVGREKKGVSPLSRQTDDMISELAQEMIFNTCTEVVYMLGEIWFHGATEKAWKTFARLARHRIGNELSSVDTLLSLAKDEMLPQGSQVATVSAEDLDIMLECLKASRGMLTQQANLATEVEPKRQWVAMRPLVRRSLRGTVPTTAIVRVSIRKHASRGYLDPSLIGQALRELAKNAIRTGGERVQIDIEIAVQSLAARSRGRGASRQLRISFQNTGPSIDAKDAKRIFDPFVTLAPMRKGGLGLATVRQIVEAHDGTIRAEPWSKGGHFIILLPLARKSQ